jgi:transcriptional regulator with XRE-family HTH domain
VTIRPRKIHNLAFGKVLADLRLKAGWSQETLGFETNMDRSFISLLERGKRSPTLDTIVSLAQVLGLSITQLSSLVEAKLEMMDESSADST